MDALWWMRKCTRTRDEQDEAEPYKPFPERAYFDELHAAWLNEPVLLVEKSRTMMLTWWGAGECLWLAMARAATRVIFWAQDERRALKPLEYCRVLWTQQEPELKSLWPLERPMRRQGYNRMELGNESLLLALPGTDPDKIRSEHPTVVMMDEAAFIEQGGEAFDVALATRVPKVLVISSAAPSWFRNLTREAIED